MKPNFKNIDINRSPGSRPRYKRGQVAITKCDLKENNGRYNKI